MASRFDWLSTSKDYLILTFHWFILAYQFLCFSPLNALQCPTVIVIEVINDKASLRYLLSQSEPKAYTVEPRYNEVSRYRKKCSLQRGLRYSEDPVITN